MRSGPVMRIVDPGHGFILLGGEEIWPRTAPKNAAMTKNAPALWPLASRRPVGTSRCVSQADFGRPRRSALFSLDYLERSPGRRVFQPVIELTTFPGGMTCSSSNALFRSGAGRAAVRNRLPGLPGSNTSFSVSVPRPAWSVRRARLRSRHPRTAWGRASPACSAPHARPACSGRHALGPASRCRRGAGGPSALTSSWSGRRTPTLGQNAYKVFTGALEPHILSRDALVALDRWFRSRQKHERADPFSQPSGPVSRTRGAATDADHSGASASATGSRR